MTHRNDRYVDHKLVRYGPRQMISDAIAAVVRFFAFSNIKHAFRSVTGGFREFSAFFGALVLAQLLFLCPILASDGRAAVIREEAYNAADYHIKISGLTDSEWSDIYNRNFYVDDNLDTDLRIYDSYIVNKYQNYTGKTYIEVKFLLKDDLMSSADLFLSSYNFDGENIDIDLSPRLSYIDKVNSMSIITVLIVIGTGVLAIAILLILYNIRINHYKFRYGVYMSFGANFEKLFQTAAWELFAISLLTLLPAIILAIGIQTVIYFTMGSKLVIIPSRLIWLLIWNLVVIFFSVLPSVKILATKTPTSLIVAEDNSNYVSSPRVSFRIFNKSFPVNYELFGFWRFRRYYATLLVSAIVFTSLFLCGFLINDMVNAEEETPRAQFSLTAPAIDDDLRETISMINGVDYVLWENSVSGTAIHSYCILNSLQRSNISSKTVKTDRKGYYGDNNFKYTLFDEFLCEQVSQSSAWRIEGDISDIFTDKYSVVVSEYINNSRALNFEVGDTLQLGIFKGMLEPLSTDKYDKKYILSQLVNNGLFDFVTVTVAAVVDTGDNDDEYMIGMAQELFDEVVGKNISTDELLIYCEDGMNYEQIDTVYGAIRSELSVHDEANLTDLCASMQFNVYERTTMVPIVMICSIVLLVISPPVWFFSQSMFGNKRRAENDMLSTFGATDRDISKFYLFSGGALAVPACLATALLGWSISELVYWLVNEYLTSLGMGSDVRFSYQFSFTGLIICIVISVISAILSTYRPFILWKRDREWTAKRHIGE